VTVTFDEDVDQTVSPTVELTGLTQSYTVTGDFVDSTTWEGDVTIADDEEELTAAVEVSGVRDLVGNLQTPDPDSSGSVQVDTVTPTISNVAATHTGGGTVELTFDSNETLTNVSVDVSGPEPTTLTEADFTESSDTYTATFDAADGDYTATLTTAEDAAGNDGAAGQDSVTVDTTAPVFSALSPEGTTETTDQPTITVDISDATEGVNASSIRATITDRGGTKLDAATTDTTGISYADGTLTVDTSTAGVSLAEGSVDVTVEANDTVDNANETTFSFTVDTVAPQFSNASPAGETVTDNQSAITVDVSDATAGVDESSLAVTLEDDTGSAFLTNAGTSTDGISFDETTLTVDPAETGVLPNGTVTVNVSAEDTVANTDSTEFAFEVDVPPTISVFSAADTEGRNATVSFESTDELDAVQVAVSGAETAMLDLADFSETADGDGFVYEAVYEGSTDGTYAFELQNASDGRTDSAASETASVLVDEAAPDVTLDAPNGGELFRGGETVTITWTATDNVSVAPNSVVLEYSTDDGNSWNQVDGAAGIANGGSYDWDVPAVDSSDVRVRVSANDSSSNTGSDASDATFTVDSTAPGISNYAVTNPDGQNVTVSFESTEELDAVSVAVSNATTRGLALGNFTVSGSGPYTYTATFDGGAEGTYDTTLDAAADAAGNDGATTESGSADVDTVTPTVSGFTATNPSGQTVNVSFESDERLATAEVSLETPSGTTTLSSFTEVGSGPYTYYATAGGEDGDYSATLVAAADDHGNDAADSQGDSVTVDTTPPTVSNYTVTNPTGQQVRVHFDADEPIDTVSVEVTGAESATITTDNPTVVDGSYVVTYAGNADGTYTATLAGAVDASGNDGGGDSASTTIQTAAPIISGFTASNPEAQNVTVSFGSDEPLANITVDISGAETATLTETNFTESGDTYTATYGGASNGTYTAVLQTAADADGDDGASGQTNSATVGTTAEPVTGPTVTNFSLANPTGRELRVSFDSSASLADVGVAVTGPDTATLTTGAFNESDGTYTATVAVDADGTYTATLFEATDGSGDNGANSESDAVTVDTSTDDGGDSGSSGGGSLTGGSPNAGAPPTPTGPSVSVTATGTSAASIAVEDADGGEALSVSLENATTGPVDVTGMNVTTRESMDYSMAVLTSTDAAPGSPAFDGRAVGYLNVAHSFADADVERATVTVRVAAERFEDTDLAPRDTTVYRYHDGEWQTLDTRVVGQDDDSYVLEAETPGFSVFAVGVRDADVVRVSGASVTASASEVGESVAVSATVENTAAYRANVTLSVVANGSTVASEPVSVAAADTATTTIDVVFDAPGNYRLAVGNTSAGTLSVSERATGTTTQGTGTPEETNTTSTTTTDTTPTGDATTATGESSDGDVPGLGVLGGLLAAVLAALAATRRT
jgi:PGF-pre-PGF domain-containing protein